MTTGQREKSHFIYLIDKLQAGHLSSQHTINIMAKYFVHLNDNVDRFFESLPPWITKIHCFMDNTVRTNKNQYVLSFFHHLVEIKRFKQLTVSFLIAGHTKFSVDSLFASTGNIFNNNNVFTLRMLKDILSPHTQVLIFRAENMKNWRDHLSFYYSSLPSITKYHQFVFQVRPVCGEGPV